MLSFRSSATPTLMAASKSWAPTPAQPEACLRVASGLFQRSMPTRSGGSATGFRSRGAAAATVAAGAAVGAAVAAPFGAAASGAGPQARGPPTVARATKYGRSVRRIGRLYGAASAASTPGLDLRETKPYPERMDL